MAAFVPPPKKVSKSTLSMFLRTRCDKELYLSLHQKAELLNVGLPAQVKRPGIGALTTAGKDFEIERYEQLIRLLPPANIVFRRPAAGGRFVEQDLGTLLRATAAVPRLLITTKFSMAGIKDRALARIGISAPDRPLIPQIADFVPDIVIIRPAAPGDSEICTDGSRRIVDVANEQRFALDIIDVKHTSEANPSYLAEIALYALMMANWIASQPDLAQRFYVALSAKLWTRFKQGDSRIDELEQRGGATVVQLFAALNEDCEDANLRFYLAAVRRFFEDVARVVRVGDASPTGWANLEWHVASTCSNCDWLGDTRHVAAADRPLLVQHPDHYCMPAATRSGHLSLVPGITRGARRTLQRHAIPDAATLAAAAGHQALQQHTALKREARVLPRRTNAILARALATDPTAVIASLARYPNAYIHVTVNFDASSGLLTGLSLAGYATAYITGQRPLRFAVTPYVVDQKSLAAEWVALESFLLEVGSRIEQSERFVGGRISGQIHFWEERQFKELCNALGRHLPQVFNLASRHARALAWLFPAEELLPQADVLEAATVVAVDEIVRRLVFTPTPHVITLFDASEHYPATHPIFVRDPYYREYLSNGIPRERIYEIWSNAQQVRRGPSLIPRNTVIAQYSDALETQARALESVCERLRRDYTANFRARAPHIPTSVPLGARGVAFDGKLWIWWDNLEFNAAQLEAHMQIALDGERLEATYDAVLLTNGRRVGPGLIEYDVAPGSTEAKFREDDTRFALGKLGRPGFPLERAGRVIAPTSPPYHGNQNKLNIPLWAALDVSLMRFDRVARIARLQFSSFGDPQFVPYLFANSTVDLLNDVFISDSKSPAGFNWGSTSAGILDEIGEPRIATPDPNAQRAMGIRPRRAGGPASPVTPAAEVLWTAPQLSSLRRIPSAVAQASALYAAQAHGLNPSQQVAIQSAEENALTVIWGPPGTGKTWAVAAFVHATARRAIAAGRPLKILVAGPTYKAVEHLIARIIRLVFSDPAAALSIYMLYSGPRAQGAVGPLPPHVTYSPFIRDPNDPTFTRCQHDITNAQGIVIVATHIKQAYRFSKAIRNSYLADLFDVVIIDESSQVPVSHALSALAVLKPDGRLIVAGDEKQMPPISSIEPPVGAEYLVGSVQTYLRQRPFGAPVAVRVLDQNYRSGQHIVDFAKRIGYPSALTSVHPGTALHLVAPPPARAAYPPTLPWCADFQRLLDPAVQAGALVHEDDVSSQGNHFEARLVAGLVWTLRQCVSRDVDGQGAVNHGAPTPARFWEMCIGIVTPHRAQRALIIRELNALFPGEQNLVSGAVDTVERFQGGERHTIIVSFGVADTDVISGEEEFLLQLERTNVAISRSMAKCLVVMPTSLAAHIPEDKRALETASAFKEYVEEFCNLRVDTALQDGAVSRWAQIRVHV
jgi:hypothetical protein